MIAEKQANKKKGNEGGGVGTRTILTMINTSSSSRKNEEKSEADKSKEAR
jgi:hypothetical protein